MTVRCVAWYMLITFERVRAVGLLDMGRRVSACHNNREPETPPAGHLFETARGTPHRNEKRGVKRRKKEGQTKLRRDGSTHAPAETCKKGVHAHTPLLIALVDPLYAREKPKTRRVPGRGHGGSSNGQYYDLESTLPGTCTSPSAKAASPLLVNTLGGGYAFCLMPKENHNTKKHKNKINK